jgi:hypothetical protein
MSEANDEVVEDGLVEDAGELGKYKVLSPIEYTDENGVPQGMTEVGSIQEVPVMLGDSWVAQGLAEKVEEAGV